MSTQEYIEERLGAFPSAPDSRHYRVRSPSAVEVTDLPDAFDGLLPYQDPSWYDQGNVGSCVGWAGSIAMEITNNLLDLEFDDLSAGWLYSKSRLYANIPPHIEGSTNLGLMKALNKLGATTEECCPTDTVRPWGGIDPCEDVNDPESVHYPGKYAIDSYWYVNPFVTDFQAAIYGVTHPAPYKMPTGEPGKIPLITAFPVYESFSEGGISGIVPMPKPGEKLLGGHSSVLRGWEPIDGVVHFKNTGTWGRDQGDDGTFYIPAGYPFYEGFIIHNGPPTVPTPSQSKIGQTVSTILNGITKITNRRGRFQYVNM